MARFPNAPPLTALLPNWLYKTGYHHHHWLLTMMNVTLSMELVGEFEQNGHKEMAWNPICTRRIYSRIQFTMSQVTYQSAINYVSLPAKQQASPPNISTNSTAAFSASTHSSRSTFGSFWTFEFPPPTVPPEDLGCEKPNQVKQDTNPSHIYKGKKSISFF